MVRSALVWSPAAFEGVADLGYEDFPRTASGKIQKFVLRAALAPASPASHPATDNSNKRWR